MKINTKVIRYLTWFYVGDDKDIVVPDFEGLKILQTFGGHEHWEDNTLILVASLSNAWRNRKAELWPLFIFGFWKFKMKYWFLSLVFIHKDVMHPLENLKIIIQSSRAKWGHSTDPNKALVPVIAPISYIYLLKAQRNLPCTRWMAGWLRANLVPIFKKESNTDPGNNMPISLTFEFFDCCRLMEHIIFM